MAHDETFSDAVLLNAGDQQRRCSHDEWLHLGVGIWDRKVCAKCGLDTRDDSRRLMTSPRPNTRGGG